MAGTFPLVRRLVAVALLMGACAGESDHRLLADQQAGADELTSITTETPSTTEPATSVSSTTTTQRAPDPPPTTVTTAPPAGGSVVTRVVDGDTFEVQIDGHTEDVRIIGINSPEWGECLAAEAGRWLRARVGGKAVRLVADETDRDQYGRLLRYVELDGADVGVEIVRAGLAVARRYPPDTARAEALEAAQQEAKAATVGMWRGRVRGGGDAERRHQRDPLRRRRRRQPQPERRVGADHERGAAPGPSSPGGCSRTSRPATATTSPPASRWTPAPSVTVRSGCGTDTATDLHWCNAGTAVWNNSGDTAFLLDPAGNVVDSRSG